MSRRSEDNLTNKIKKVLGLSKDKEKPIAFQKSSTKEIIFTPERLRVCMLTFLVKSSRIVWELNLFHLGDGYCH